MPDLELGVSTTVVVDGETHCPTRLDYDREGLRQILVRDCEELYGEQEDSDPTHEPLVDDIEVVSVYSLHVALYALQNPTPENIQRGLYRLGTGGDCEEHIDPGTLMPLPVGEPSGWNHWMPEGLRAAATGAEPLAAEPSRQSSLLTALSDLRNTYAAMVDRKEEAGEDATYQRGLVAGLQAAIGKVEGSS